MKNSIIKIVFSLFIFLPSLYAAPTSTDTNADMKGVCELAGGTFTAGAEGTWACCWDNWGCAGCIQQVCKVKCHTQRCRKANGQAAVKSGFKRLKSFEAFGIKSVVIPTKMPKSSKNPNEAVKQE